MKKNFINIDQDPSSAFEDVPSPPMSIERQERIFTCIKDGNNIDDMTEVRRIFKDAFGYEPSI